jgi:hypothetical protein
LASTNDPPCTRQIEAYRVQMSTAATACAIDVQVLDHVGT